MITNTKGLVLNYIKYGDTSIIVKIFTEKYGLRSFIVNGIRSQKAKRSIGHYQPFTLLDLNIYWSENRDLLRISEAKIDHATPGIHYDIRKSAIALFLSEILLKTLYHEQQEYVSLYKFLESNVHFLDEANSSFENFHLVFLIRLAGYLGFALDNPNEIVTNYKTEPFVTQLINHANESNLQGEIESSGEIRKQTLESIILYYREHMDTIGEIKSLKVLHQIFH
ncbi:MAG: DNA repair protein RecO (recombination protein O) [Cyclobacteriaceae bacterium]